MNELETERIELTAKISVQTQDLADDNRQALGLPQAIGQAQTELAVLQSGLANMEPESKEYLQRERDISRKTTELKNLEIRELTIEGPGFVLRQYDQNLSVTKLEVIEAFKAAVDARKATLAAEPPAVTEANAENTPL